MNIRLPQSFSYPGGKTGVVLVHAYTGSPIDVHLTGRFLARHGYAVEAPLLAGHGTMNPLDILAATPQQWLLQVQQAVFQLSNRCEYCLVFGVSLGGLLSLAALMDNTHIVGGGSFSAPIWQSVSTTISPMFKDYAATIYDRAGIDSKQVESDQLQINAQLPKQLAAIDVVRRQVKLSIPQISTPLFIAQGINDTIVKAADTRTAVQSCQADYHEYAAGHVLTVNNAHQQLEEDLLNYITTIEKRCDHA